MLRKYAKEPVEQGRLSGHLINHDLGVKTVWDQACGLLSAQCIISIAQIIKSVCVSVSQWVCHTNELPIVKPEVELILTIAPMENTFNVKFLDNGERYDDGLKEGQIGNQWWARDWH